MRKAIALSWLCALLSGCTFVNATSEHRDPLPASEFCMEFARIACRGYLECCPTANVAVTLEQCIPPVAAECATDFGALAVDPRTGYDDESAARVAADGARYVDECSLELTTWLVQRTGFQSVLQGTVPGGERCGPPSIDEVAPIFSCERDDQSCVLGGGVWECSARRAEGESCLLTWDCQDGLYCTSLIAGTCRPRQEPDALCASNDACASLLCRGGRCVPQTVETVYCGITEMM